MIGIMVNHSADAYIDESALLARLSLTIALLMIRRDKFVGKLCFANNSFSSFHFEVRKFNKAKDTYSNYGVLHRPEDENSQSLARTFHILRTSDETAVYNQAISGEEYKKNATVRIKGNRNSVKLRMNISICTCGEESRVR